jgi:HD superfamily phosphodiesterase
MNKESCDEIVLLGVLKAQDILREKSFDPIHAVEHHQKTWENVQWIVNNEGLEKSVDFGVLRLAAWWHDVDRGKANETESFEKYCEDSNISPILVNKVTEVINEHSFGQLQNSLEGKILYDADKLEYVSILRVETLLEMNKEGKIDNKVFDYYKIEWAKRINKVKGSLNFVSTRIRFNNELAKFVEYGLKTPFFADLARSVI